MSGATLTFTLDDGRLLDRLRALARRSHALRPLMSSIGEALVHSTWERFEEETSPAGNQWKPVIPEYAVTKRVNKTLTGKTSRLRDSIVARPGDDAVEVGTNVVYAAIHHFGGTILPKQGPYLHFRIGERKVKALKVEMPERPFLGVSAEDLDTISEIVADYFTLDG